MINAKKIRRTIYVIIGLWLIGYIFYYLHAVYVASNANPVTESGIIPIDYKELFNNDAKSKLILTKTFNFKSRNAISLFHYNNSFLIEVTKFSISSKFDVLKQIREVNSESNANENSLRFPVFERFMPSSYKLVSKDRVANYCVNIVGDSTETVFKNDSIANYFSRAISFSVGSNLNNDTEIEGETNKTAFFLPNDNHVPINIAFIKKRDYLYFVLLIPNQPDIQVDQKYLYRLLNIRN